MEDLVTCLHERGFIEAFTGEDLHALLKNPVKAYIGFDPTADSLHLGNFVGMQLLSWFQKFGHTPVIVLGERPERSAILPAKAKKGLFWMMRPLFIIQPVFARILKKYSIFPENSQYLFFSIIPIGLLPLDSSTF